MLLLGLEIFHAAVRGSRHHAVTTVENWHHLYGVVCESTTTGGGGQVLRVSFLSVIEMPTTTTPML